MKFYRKNTVVEAEQYPGGPWRDGVVNETEQPMVHRMGRSAVILKPGELAIDLGNEALHDYRAMAPGDWLVTNEPDDIFPMSDVIFQARYAPLPEVTGETSDGYHTFNELYDHRHHLFAVILNVFGHLGFKTRKTSDGREMEGWFIAGLNTSVGQISYHMPEVWWERLSFLYTIEQNDRYDGHTAADVLVRLRKLTEDEVEVPLV